MVLVYEFIYSSNNGVLENFLEIIANESNIDHYITKDGDNISLHAQDKHDNLEEFSRKLSDSLPYSIFLKLSRVYIGEYWNTDNASEIPKCEIYLPFTKKAFERGKESFNPFIDNEVGMNYKFYPPIMLKLNGGYSRYDDCFDKAFQIAADIVAGGGKINIKTLSGIFCLSKIEDKNYSSEVVVMPTDLGVVNKMVAIKNEDIALLASLEKPLIYAHTNLVFASKYPNFPRFVNIGMANDLFLYLISSLLFKSGIEFVVLEEENSSASCDLHFEQDIPNRRRLRVLTLQNGQNIIIGGTWHIKPQTLRNIKFLTNPHHTQFATAMKELKLFDKANYGIYLSLTHNDKMMFYGDQVGVLDILNVEFDDSMSQIFHKIESENSFGSSLLQKYKNEFPDIFQTIKNISFKNAAKNISNLWGIAALIAGLGADFYTAKQKLLENIEIFSGEKGPRIDYKFINENSAKMSLNIYRFLGSVMSFKIAGVDDEILSYGIAESLIHFISDFIDKLKDELKAKNILLMGSLFSNKALSNLSVKHLCPNYSVYFNKELPLELYDEDMQNL